MRHLPKLETFDVASVCPHPFAREILATLRGNVTVSCLLPISFPNLQFVSFPNLQFFLHFFGVAGLTGSKYRRSFLSDRTRQTRVCLLSLSTDAGRRILRFKRQTFFDLYKSL
jgi:hypothetical protein